MNSAEGNGGDSYHSNRRKQLLDERTHRLELMLNDTGAANDYSDTYDYSDWSMEAILSDTTRNEMDVTAPETPKPPVPLETPCRHCRCPSNSI